MITVGIEDVLEAMAFVLPDHEWRIHPDYRSVYLLGPDSDRGSELHRNFIILPCSDPRSIEALFDYRALGRDRSSEIHKEEFWMARSFVLRNLDRWKHLDAFPRRRAPSAIFHEDYFQKLVWGAICASNEDESPEKVELPPLDCRYEEDAPVYTACARLMEALGRARRARLIGHWRWLGGTMSFDVGVTSTFRRKLSLVNAAMVLSWLPWVMQGDEQEMPAFLDSMSYLAEHIDWSAVCAR